jgi:peptidyl-prolyl cis-trans isomerase A (cyclophilin A)
MTRTGIAIVSLALLAGACDKSSKQESAPPKPTDQPGDKPGAKAGPASSFTIAQATEGLPGTGKLMAEITTEMGVITCELFADQAPDTVANFVGLARGLKPWQDPTTGEWVKRPFYDGLAFHRVIPGFMIQGGDPQSRDYNYPRLGTGSPGFRLSGEAPPFKFDVPGRLAMANAGSLSSAGSQFFITEAPRSTLDGADGEIKYAIFGQCDPVTVVKQITGVPRNGNDKPDTPVTMQVRIYRK